MSTSQVTTSATPFATTERNRLRRPAWMLIASLPTFVAFMVIGALSMPTERAADLTGDQLRALALPWTVINLLWAAAFLLGGAAVFVLTRSIRRSGRRALVVAVRALAGAGIAAFIAYLTIQFSVLATEARSVGDEPLHAAATLSSAAGSWMLLAATALLALGLRSADVLRKSGIVLAVCTLVYLTVDVASWLPVFLGATAPSDAGALPPALSGVLWFALGVTLLRHRVSSAL